MTFKNNLVACIKANNKVLREHDNTVRIPFGSEYIILIKNLNSVRCRIKVSIDGTDISNNNWFIIQPNSSMELKRSNRAGNLTKGNKFKFIERTERIENTRGIEAEDGLIRIEYQFEKKKLEIVQVYHNHNHNHYNGNWSGWPHYPITYNTCDVLFRQTQTQTNINTVSGISPTYKMSSTSYSTSCQNSRNNIDVQNAVQNNEHEKIKTLFAKNDVGITVPGSISEQKFSTDYSYFDAETSSHVITLHLRGKIGETKIEQAVTVKTKPQCTICRKVNKTTNKFCSECGTSLTII